MQEGHLIALLSHDEEQRFDQFDHLNYMRPPHDRQDSHCNRMVRVVDVDAPDQAVQGETAFVIRIQDVNADEDHERVVNC